MGADTLTLLRGSRAKALAIASQAAELFYNNRFAPGPALIPLFRGDMHVHGARPMA